MNTIDKEKKKKGKCKLPVFILSLTECYPSSNPDSTPATSDALIPGTPTACTTPLSDTIAIAPPPLAEEEDILSLAEALKGISTNLKHTVVPIQSPWGKAKFYSVIVGRCCGVFSSW